MQQERLRGFEEQRARGLALGGRNTNNSVQGGIFGAPPEPERRSREAVDGKTGGRFNSSSVAGGIFAGEEPRHRHIPNRPHHHMNSSVQGGIFAGGQPPPPGQPPAKWSTEAVGFGGNRAHSAGPFAGSGGRPSTGGAAGGQAAGGRGSNAGREWAHTRGALGGGPGGPGGGALGGPGAIVAARRHEEAAAGGHSSNAAKTWHHQRGGLRGRGAQYADPILQQGGGDDPRYIT